MIDLFKRAREQVNLFLFDNKDRVKGFFYYLTFLASIVLSIVILVYYGYEHSAEELRLLQNITKWGFLVFLSNFFVRLFFTFEKLEFIKNTKFEGVLMLILITELVSELFFDKTLVDIIFKTLGIEVYESVYVLFTQLYIMLFISIQLIKYLRQAIQLSIKPAILFILSFLGIILIGTGLLMLPEMTVAPGSMNFVDALFTSASATCITGLIVVDTATFFTVKGQAVILFLMQLGGIGILSFASFFAFFLKKGLSFRHQTVLQDFFSEDSLDSSKKLIRQIIFFTVSIEAAGIFLIYILWDDAIVFSGFGEKLFYSIFHGVSAFCNAGFALFSEGLMAKNVIDSFLLQIVLAILIILGGIGFPALRDILSVDNLRERLEKPWKQWKLSTSVAVSATILLLVFGTVAFFILEKNNTLTGMNGFERVITSFFQSVTTRTAGFNTVDIGALTMPTLIVFLFLMFIGASSGGTGGGIKTSTFFLILLSVRATITDKNQLQYKRRNIPYTLLNKAYSVFIFSTTSILVSVFILSISEKNMDVMQLTFEAVSAFSTVGISMGITADLSTVGKIVIVIAMFTGRVGLLTFAFALSKKVQSNKFTYPNTNMMVG